MVVSVWMSRRVALDGMLDDESGYEWMNYHSTGRTAEQGHHEKYSVSIGARDRALLVPQFERDSPVPFERRESQYDHYDASI
jgi:hypothetical protein